MHELTLQPDRCPIQGVTVFLQGAQVLRAGALPLAAGETLLVLERLPAGLLAESIQASLGEGAEILSVEHRINHLDEPAWDAAIREHRDRLEALVVRRRKNEAAQASCRAQEEMLVANRSMAGAHTGLQAAELREGVRFFRECMEELKDRQLALEVEREELELEIELLDNQLGSMNSRKVQPVSEIVLRLLCASGGEIPLSLSYFVRNAGWTPAYDVRARDTASPIRVSCKAHIAQSTGEDWDGVELVVSTGSPAGSAACPELSPWHIDFERPRGGSRMSQSFNATKVRKTAESMEMESLQEMRDDLDQVPAPAAPMPAPEPVGARVDRGLTTVEYRIPAPCTVLSGKGEQTVEMVAHEMQARYQYRSVRKLDKEVYLIARVGDYARLNLVAGEANIFLGNKYVGKSFIDPRRGEEEIDWSLGADKAVVVTRQKGKNFTAGGLGGNLKLTREWELTARNLKDEAIRIELQDQIPVSDNKQIQVEPAELSGGVLDKNTGLVKWELELAPSAAKTLKIRYVVIHPKSATVYLD